MTAMLDNRNAATAPRPVLVIVGVDPELAPCLADGVVFVSLAELREPALVLPTIAHRLGLREGGTRPLRVALSSKLDGLIADNNSNGDVRESRVCWACPPPDFVGEIACVVCANSEKFCRYG
jgi:hypothetical protein